MAGEEDFEVWGAAEVDVLVGGGDVVSVGVIDEVMMKEGLKIVAGAK